MNKQKGSATIWDIGLVIILIGYIVFYLVAGSQATPEEVQAVVEKAKASPAATAIVQSALKGTPTPTKGELASVLHKVEEQLTLDISKSATGDPSLVSNAAKQEELRKKASVEFDNSPLSSIFNYAGIFLAVAVIWLIFSWLRNANKAHN